MDALLVSELKKLLANASQQRELYTIREFCAVENISRSTFNKLCLEGKGPELKRLPGMALKRISHKARLQWRARMDELAAAEAAAPAYRARQADLIEKKRKAGRAGAASKRRKRR